MSDMPATNGIIHVIDQVKGSDTGQQKALWHDLIRIPLCPGSHPGPKAERRPAGDSGFPWQLFTLQTVSAGRKHLW